MIGENENSSPTKSARLDYSYDKYMECLKNGIWGDRSRIADVDFEEVCRRLIKDASYVDLSGYLYYLKNEYILPEDKINERIEKVCIERIRDIANERFESITFGTYYGRFSYTDRKILEREINVLYGNGFIPKDKAIKILNSCIDEINRSVAYVPTGGNIYVADSVSSCSSECRSQAYSTAATRKIDSSYPEAELIIQAHGVRSLFHFSQLSNLDSIIRNGILPVDELRRRGIRFSYNDEKRYDGRTDSTSVSVGFPNYKMFYMLRCVNPNAHWVVFEIDPSILKIRNFSLFYTNAAKGGGVSETNNVDVFFGSSDNQYPEDPQAEILIRGNIPEGFIKNIYVYSDEDLKKNKKMSRKIKINRNVFNKRNI